MIFLLQSIEFEAPVSINNFSVFSFEIFILMYGRVFMYDPVDAGFLENFRCETILLHRCLRFD